MSSSKSKIGYIPVMCNFPTRLPRSKSGRVSFKSEVDTAVLVDCEVHQNTALQTSNEEISLDITRKTETLHSPTGNGSTFSEDAFFEDLKVTAHKLDDKYRYHAFIAYNSNDRLWVKDMVGKLETAPYCFKCCYDERDFDKNTSEIQNIVCSIMLSERVIVVLSPPFMNSTWPQYEESLAHITSISAQKQRVVALVLEECEVPDGLKMLNLINVQNRHYWNRLLLYLQHDGVCRSETTSTMWSLVSTPVGFSNGQLLSTVSSHIAGCLRSSLVFDHDEVPNAFFSQEISIDSTEYADLVKDVGREELLYQLPWVYTAIPSLVLVGFFIAWCIAFICIIVLFPDDTAGTLPVRLCVFILPAMMIVSGCFLRWRRIRIGKEHISVGMFSRSIQANKELFKRQRPIIMTTARTKDDKFNIFFLFYNRQECVDHMHMFLQRCTDQDMVKLSRLIDVYTASTGYLDGTSIAERLSVMMSSAYAIQHIFKQLPHPLEQRHTRRRQCLCQFCEEFLTAYLPCLRHEGAFDIRHLQILFLRYLNCQFNPQPIIMHTLGIGLSHVLR